MGKLLHHFLQCGDSPDQYQLICVEWRLLSILHFLHLYACGYKSQTNKQKKPPYCRNCIQTIDIAMWSTPIGTSSGSLAWCWKSSGTQMSQLGKNICRVMGSSWCLMFQPHPSSTPRKRPFPSAWHDLASFLVGDYQIAPPPLPPFRSCSLVDALQEDSDEIHALSQLMMLQDHAPTLCI